jgi:hypothetical protein
MSRGAVSHTEPERRAEDAIRENHRRGLHRVFPRDYCPDCRQDAAEGEGRR